MRKLGYILLILLTAHSSYGQKIRFTDTSNKWTRMYYYSASGFSLTDYAYYGDTVINGMVYKIFDRDDRILKAYIREDTLLGKVFIKRLSSIIPVPDTNEVLLYNFMLNIGDTVLHSTTSTDTTFSYVTQIDSTTIGGIKHKVWTVKVVIIKPHYHNTDEYTYIEGIGCTIDPLFPLEPERGGPILSLICFQNKGVTPLVSPQVLSGYFYFDNAQSCKLSVSRTISGEKNITIYPNPANENSVIKLPYKFQSGKLAVVNTFGQTVQQRNISNNEQLVLGALPAAGLYFYQIIDILADKTYKGKFVYQY